MSRKPCHGGIAAHSLESDVVPVAVMLIPAVIAAALTGAKLQARMSHGVPFVLNDVVG